MQKEPTSHKPIGSTIKNYFNNINYIIYIYYNIPYFILLKRCPHSYFLTMRICSLSIALPLIPAYPSSLLLLYSLTHGR